VRAPRPPHERLSKKRLRNFPNELVGKRNWYSEIRVEEFQRNWVEIAATFSKPRPLSLTMDAARRRCGPSRILPWLPESRPASSRS